MKKTINIHFFVSIFTLEGRSLSFRHNLNTFLKDSSYELYILFLNKLISISISLKKFLNIKKFAL